MSPYYYDDSVTLWHGDSLEVVRQLDSGSVDCIVTSPPYYGLRDYGIEGQYGLEESPAAYVETMRALFAEARRVLADDGTLWLNIGDSYSSSSSNNGGYSSKSTLAGFTSAQTKGRAANESLEPRALRPGIPAKNLLGIPWRVAFALQDDGWILRNDIIWAKPNAMPESVTDRLSTRHEHLFMFAKSRRYWFDLDPIREALARPDVDGSTWVFGGANKASATGRQLTKVYTPDDRGRNPGDVWAIPTQPYPDAHFAVMPQALASRAIQAGCKPQRRGCDCDDVVATPSNKGGQRDVDPTPTNGRRGMNRERINGEGTRPITKREQRGHAEQLRHHEHRAEIEAMAGPAFAHYIRTDSSGARPLPPELLADLTDRGWLNPVPPCDHEIGGPGVVLDPFSGSGTTGLAAAKHGRKYVGIDLNADYLDLSLRTRLAQAALFEEETA